MLRRKRQRFANTKTSGSTDQRNLADDRFKQAIVDILVASGESFLDDHGVDRNVCAQVAAEIIEELQRQPVRVLVAIRGGCLQGALADLPKVAIQLFDYDTFECAARDDEGRTAEEAEKQWAEAQATMHAVF